MRAFGVILAAGAGLLAIYGIWLLTSEDLQGGRDALGAVAIAIAMVAAVFALFVFSLGRRS